MNIRYLYIVMLALLPACSNSDEAATTEAETSEDTVVLDSVQQATAGIVTGTAETRQMHQRIRLNGMVDVPPQSLVSVSFPLGGYLKSTPLLPGMHVNKGQVIGIMEDQSYVQLQQDYLIAKAKMEFLEADMQRQKELSDADAASRKTYQQALSEFKTQQVLIRSLEEKLQIIRIDPSKLSADNISRTVPVYAPISGFVSKVNVNIGRYVNPVDVLFELLNPDDIHAAITVFEKDINAFNIGLKGTVYLNDNQDKPHPVEVILVTHNIDENRTGLVHCHFEDPDHSLLPGMYLNGVFELSNRSVTALPENAVVRYMGKEYIFLTTDQKQFTMTEVQTGLIDAGYVEIQDSTGSLFANHKVVLQGAYAILGKLKNKMD